MGGLDALTILAILVFGPGYLILLWYCIKACFLFTKDSIVGILQRLRRKMSPIQVHHVDLEDTPPPNWVATTLATTSADYFGGPNTSLEDTAASRATTPLTTSSAGYSGGPSYSDLEDIAARRTATTTFAGYFGGPHNSGRFASGRRVAVIVEFPGGLPVREYLGR